MKFVSILTASALLAGCSTIAQPPTHLTGNWGGPHVGLSFESGFGTLEYDCATGTIDMAVFPAPDGSFTATGTHRPGQGGPVRVGQIFISHRATYAGKVTDDVMTLSARLENGTTIGPYTLTKGAPPQLMRCL